MTKPEGWPQGQLDEIRALWGDFHSLDEIAEKYEVTRGAVASVIMRYGIERPAMSIPDAFETGIDLMSDRGLTLPKAFARVGVPKAVWFPMWSAVADRLGELPE